MLKKIVRWLWPKDEEVQKYTEELVLTPDTLHIIHVNVGKMSKSKAEEYIEDYSNKIRQASGVDETKFKFIVVGEWD
jgi:hypothetical protein